MQFAPAAKQASAGGARIVLVGFYGGARIATLGRQRPGTRRRGRLRLSSFPVLLSRFPCILMLPLSCMCMTTSTTHACRRSPSLHSTTQLFAMPVASHTGLTRSLCLPEVLLVMICVCLQIALRTCCSSLAKSELVTDRSSQPRSPHILLGSSAPQASACVLNVSPKYLVFV